VSVIHLAGEVSCRSPIYWAIAASESPDKSGSYNWGRINQGFLNKFDFNNSDDRHIFGTVYESILVELRDAGNIFGLVMLKAHLFHFHLSPSRRLS
jgi:hypothetical protein